MILRTGIDLIEIARIHAAIERHGERFLRRVFTPAELADCSGRSESLAARFAAKEAASKALGTGIGVVAWREIEILGDDLHAPLLRLYGAAAQKAQELGLTTWSVSLSHSQSQAAAVVVMVGK